jgi:glyoxylase-like metal-dependent hydrolase (beta-lactamase superfamily II)/rhodanese-related sulfurtransferase
MKFEQLGPAACRSYLVSCERSRDAFVVDPLAEDVNRVLAKLDRDGLALRLAIDTHTHADHLSGGAALAEKTGASYAAHQTAGSPKVTVKLTDGDMIQVGDVYVQVIHTPGHSPDSITLRAGGALMTGDFLFLAQDGAGRLDLPGGDAGAHWDSLQKLSEFSDEHHVLPGHDYHELMDSTLGVERVRNPRFQKITREEYVAWQRAVSLPTPDWMLSVIAANLGQKELHEAHHAMAHATACATGEDGGGGGACSAGPMACVPMVPPREAARRLAETGADRPFLLDVREPFEFSGPMGRHAPGAHLLPLQQVPRRLDELPSDPEAEILVMCRSGGRSARACAFLIEQGRRRVFNVAGGIDGWVAEGLPVER